MEEKIPSRFDDLLEREKKKTSWQKLKAKSVLSTNVYLELYKWKVTMGEENTP